MEKGFIILFLIAQINGYNTKDIINNKIIDKLEPQIKCISKFKVRDLIEIDKNNKTLINIDIFEYLEICRKTSK